MSEWRNERIVYSVVDQRESAAKGADYKSAGGTIPHPSEGSTEAAQTDSHPEDAISRLERVNAELLAACKEALWEDSGLACAPMLQAAIAKAEAA